MTTERTERIRQATDQRIIEAALVIALESGTDAITIESVSRRSGVAKTTIYRRFANRQEMLDHVSHAIELPFVDVPAQPSRDSLVTLIRKLQARFEEKIGLSQIGRLLASRSAFLRLVVDRLFRPEYEALLVFFERGVRSGVFRAHVDYTVVLDAVIGSMVIRDAMTGDVPDEWPEHLVAMLWPTIAGPAAAA